MEPTGAVRSQTDQNQPERVRMHGTPVLAEKGGRWQYLCQVPGDWSKQCGVPTHFYKVVVFETPDHSLEMEAYVMPNQVIDDNTPLEVFRVPPESVERAAGLLFFDKINRKQLTKINGKKV